MIEIEDTPTTEEMLKELGSDNLRCSSGHLAELLCISKDCRHNGFICIEKGCNSY